MATHALWHMMYMMCKPYIVPKCISCHKVTVVITRRAHCFYDCLYILHLDAYLTLKQQHLGTKTKNKIFVLWNTCFDIQWQTCKNTINLISSASRKMLKMPFNAIHTWPWNLSLSDAVYIIHFSMNLCKHTSSKWRISSLWSK